MIFAATVNGKTVPVISRITIRPVYAPGSGGCVVSFTFKANTCGGWSSEPGEARFTWTDNSVTRMRSWRARKEVGESTFRGFPAGLVTRISALPSCTWRQEKVNGPLLPSAKANDEGLGVGGSARGVFAI